jgi:endogenous inhibitor of DNA gyrase (YacG/DUF329 family)
MAKPKTVACPQCGKPVDWTMQNPFRPFCSERCKTIDLDAWASERYRLPVVEDREDANDVKSGSSGDAPS